MSVLRKEQEQQ